MEPLQYTSYIKACCEALAETREYESDTLLLYLVRLQHIALKINQSLNDPMFLQLNKVPIQMHVKMLQEELESFKFLLPPGLQQNGM